MKRIVLSVVLLVTALAIKAQVATWLIPPAYDDINKVVGTNLIVTDSINKKTLWTEQGQRVYETTESLFPFRNGVAVVTKNSTTLIDGIVTARGEFISLDNLLVVHEYPYFSDGFLAVKKRGDRYYQYIDEEGYAAIQNCTAAYPFRNGYASCEAFQSTSKKRGSVPLLLDTEGQPVTMTYEGKKIDAGDVEFISSVNDDGIAVVVAEHKVYLFHADNRQLTPVYAEEGETNAKNQAMVDGDATQYLAGTQEGEKKLYARSGKMPVNFVFNQQLVPIQKVVNEVVTEYQLKSERQEWDPETTLDIVVKGDKYGISQNNVEILPPQFTDCPSPFGDKAFVKLNGKYGMLQIKPSAPFEFSMNKGNDIAFRHQRTESFIRMDIPFPVSAETIAIQMDPNSGCDLDATSRVAKTTDLGSSVAYYCMLTIPPTLSDETQEVQYKARAVYDGLISAPFIFYAKEWYYKYFNINIDDVETKINNGNLFFTFDISADKLPGEEDYPSTVNVKSGDLPVKLEKLSETRYKCSVSNLKDGINVVTIQIQEPGCPPSEYPLEVTYNKPAPKTAAKPAQKEKVVIKNNTKQRRQAPQQPARQTRRPRLEI